MHRARLVVFAVPIALVVSSCGGDQTSAVESTTSSPVATSVAQSAPPSSTAAPSVTTGPSSEGAQLPMSAGVDLESGLYAMPSWFLVPLTVELGTDWRGIRDDIARQVNFMRGQNEVGRGTQWFAPYAIPTKDVEAFIAELRATPLLAFGDLEPAEVAGLAAQQIDGQAEPNPDQAGSDDRVAGAVDIRAMRLLHNPRLTDFEWYTESSEARLRILLLERDGDTLVIYLEAPPDEFDTFLELVDPILSGMALEPSS